VIKSILHHSDESRAKARVTGPGMATLACTFAIFLLFTAAFIPWDNAGHAFAEDMAAPSGEYHPLLAIEKAVRSFGAGTADLPVASTPLEKRLEPTHAGDEGSSTVPTPPDGLSAIASLLWGAGALAIGIILALVLRRNPGRRRQKLALDVGRFPLVLPHLRSNGEPGRQEKL